MAKKTTKKKSGTRFNILAELHEKLLKTATTTRSGEVKFKRADLKNVIEKTFEEAAKRAAKGERVRFPVIGALAMKPVKARKAGKGVNPFTGEPMTIKARPESRKPRWSFPRSIKEAFGNPKNWR